MDIEKAQKHVRNAWIAGVVNGTLVLIVSLLPLIGITVLDYDLDVLGLAILIYGLTFGIYKRNRICVILLFLLNIINIFFELIIGPITYEMPVVVAFVYFYFQGVRGTFVYHRLIKKEKEISKQDINTINKSGKSFKKYKYVFLILIILFCGRSCIFILGSLGYGGAEFILENTNYKIHTVGGKGQKFFGGNYSKTRLEVSGGSELWVFKTLDFPWAHTFRDLRRSSYVKYNPVSNTVSFSKIGHGTSIETAPLNNIKRTVNENSFGTLESVSPNGKYRARVLTTPTRKRSLEETDFYFAIYDKQGLPIWELPMNRCNYSVNWEKGKIDWNEHSVIFKYESDEDTYIRTFMVDTRYLFKELGTKTFFE